VVNHKIIRISVHEYCDTVLDHISIMISRLHTLLHDNDGTVSFRRHYKKFYKGMDATLGTGLRPEGLIPRGLRGLAAWAKSCSEGIRSLNGACL
jgi:hypothetical protein